MRKVEIGWPDDNEDGERIEMMAVREAKGYRFKFRLKSEEEWTWLKGPTLAQAEKLHDILDQRYRRRRASYKEVQIAERLVKSLGG